MRRWGCPTACSWARGRRIRTPKSPMALAGPVVGHLDPQFLALLDEHERPPSPGLRHVQCLDPSGQRDRVGRHGGVLRQLRPAGRPGRRRGQRRLRRAHVRGGGPTAAPTSSGSTRPGATPSTPIGCCSAHPSPSIIAVVHAETSTGVRNDIEPLGSRARVTRCCSSTWSRRSAASRWPSTTGRVDIAYSGTQKCLGVPPGLAPLTGLDAGPGAAGRAAVELVLRPQPPGSLRQRRIGRGRVYHHTAPVTMVAALHAGLGRRSSTRGSAAVQQRHAECGQAAAGRASRNSDSSCWSSRTHRLPQLTTVRVPGRGRRRRRCRRRLLAATALRSGPEPASWRARSGGSAAWGTRHAGATS